MNSHLQSIIEKCISVNSSNMKIEYEYYVPKCDDCKKPRLAGSAMTRWKCIRCGEEHMHGNTNKPKLCKGCAIETCSCTQCGKDMKYRPITLQDILLCFAKAPIQPKYLHGYNDNDFLICLPFTEERKMNCVYDLTKSPYDQEESVLEFIFKNI